MAHVVKGNPVQGYRAIDTSTGKALTDYQPTAAKAEEAAKPKPAKKATAKKASKKAE